MFASSNNRVVEVHPDNGWQIDIISKKKLIRYLKGSNIGDLNIKKTQRLKMGMHSIL